MTINPDELSDLLAAQRAAQQNIEIIYDDDLKTPPVKEIQTPVIDYADRIAQIRANGGMTAIESLEQEPNCPDCGGSGAIGHDVPFGHPDFGKTQHCSNPIHADDRLRFLGNIGLLTDEDAKIDLYDLAEYHDARTLVQVDGLNAQKASSNLEMLNHFKTIVESPENNPLTFVLGHNGNGKTTAAKGLVNAINLANKGPAIYINLVDLIAYVKEAYDRGVSETSESRFRRIAHSRAIVVDEFEIGTGKVMATEHNFELLTRWFSERYQAAKNRTGVTVLISNEHPKKIGLTSILSRMKDFKRIANTAPDFRGNEDWNFD